MTKKARILLIVIIIAAVTGADQISKVIIRNTVEYDQRTSVVKNIVTLTRVENTGAFLSLGNKLPRPIYKALMIVMPLVVLFYILRYLFKTENISRLNITGISLITGGGIGNIIDRIAFGSVTDFLYFDFYVFHTGIVNLADIAVTTGFFILIYELIVNHWHKAETKQEAEQE